MSFPAGGRRGMRLVLFALLLLPASHAAAHVGGHGTVEGARLVIWTDPATQMPVPGTLLFVRNGEVHVEGLDGEHHVWSVAALNSQDRARAAAFVRHIADVHAGTVVPLDVAPTLGHTLMLAWPAIWLAAAFVACAGWTAPHWRRRLRPGMASLMGLTVLTLSCSGGSGAGSVTTPTPTAPSPTPATSTSLAPFFAAFPSRVRTREDASYLYVESDGLADHPMMVGIRSWQQQVPLPALYTGTNAWRLPLVPRLAAQPVSARTGLFRGAIALAVNGVPIFNALNNRGDDAFLAGELDEYGGHAGRADDYHYHTAPLFLSSQVGSTQPIGVALDGFLLYGALEPDGAPMRALDDYNGHTDTARGYHYHGTRTYPYINGGMKGEVQVSDQVEPQPSVRAVRPALTPLTGAVVTRFESTGATSWRLDYQFSGRTYRVDYRIEGAQVIFVFVDPTGATRTETYPR